MSKTYLKSDHFSGGGSLASHLVTGETLRSAAAELHISYETARTQLKNIFGKTGTCRQAELVAVIVTAFPALL